jgi:hypothetical protein
MVEGKMQSRFPPQPTNGRSLDCQTFLLHSRSVISNAIVREAVDAGVGNNLYYSNSLPWRRDWYPAPRFPYAALSETRTGNCDLWVPAVPFKRVRREFVNHAAIGV